MSFLSRVSFTIEFTFFSGRLFRVQSFAAAAQACQPLLLNWKQMIQCRWSIQERRTKLENLFSIHKPVMWLWLVISLCIRQAESFMWSDTTQPDKSEYYFQFWPSQFIFLCALKLTYCFLTLHNLPIVMRANHFSFSQK